MPIMFAIYRKFRFPFKLICAAIKYPTAQAGVKKYSVMSIEETFDQLMQNKKLSLARYGDGELEMTHYKDIGFQPFDAALSARLRSLLTQPASHNPYCLICLPDAFRSTSGMRFGSALFWFFHKSFFFFRYERLLNKNYLYGNTSVTRPYHDYNDKGLAPVIFSKFKMLLMDQRVLIIEGSGTRMGVGNDLLENAKEVRRITTLNRGAFSVYNKIYTLVSNVASDFDILLISLGPTATVLAYDLSLLGIRCIDTGHIDIEYEWMRASAKNKIRIEGKNINEVGILLSENQTIQDATYRQQVLFHVTDVADSSVTPHQSSARSSLV